MNDMDWVCACVELIARCRDRDHLDRIGESIAHDAPNMSEHDLALVRACYSAKQPFVERLVVKEPGNAPSESIEEWLAG